MFNEKHFLHRSVSGLNLHGSGDAHESELNVVCIRLIVIHRSLVCVDAQWDEWTNKSPTLFVYVLTPACEYTCLVSSQVYCLVLSVKATPSNVTHAWPPMRTTATDRAPPPVLSTLTPAPPSQDPVSKTQTNTEPRKHMAQI